MVQPHILMYHLGFVFFLHTILGPSHMIPMYWPACKAQLGDEAHQLKFLVPYS